MGASVLFRDNLQHVSHIADRSCPLPPHLCCIQPKYLDPPTFMHSWPFHSCSFRRVYRMLRCCLLTLLISLMQWSLTQFDGILFNFGVGTGGVFRSCVPAFIISLVALDLISRHLTYSRIFRSIRECNLIRFAESASVLNMGQPSKSQFFYLSPLTLSSPS